MIDVQYPKPDFQIREGNGRKSIFDPIRKTWLQLTEEEWVRQNFVAYLSKELKYPLSLLAVEKELMLNGLKKRFDILVFDHRFAPWMLVECKAPSVPLSDSVLQQALRYNMSVPVQFIVLTNGTITLGWRKQGSDLEQLDQLPAWMPG